jgi:hypothetical protein
MNKNETNKIDNESNMDKTCTLVPKKTLSLVTMAPKVRSPTQQESSETLKTPNSKNVTIDLAWDESQGLSVRQRRGETLEIPKDKEKDNALQMRHKLAELIGKIDKETKTLNQIVLGNHNTKREIKESNTKIRSLMCQVMTSEMLSMLKTQGDKADVLQKADPCGRIP